MTVDYNAFAKTFSKSREKMKWEEIEYFLWKYDLEDKNILDVWCWNWRFLQAIKDKNIHFSSYLWLDLSTWLLEEARKIHLESKFLNLNMLDLDKISNNQKFDVIFLIASFHHLQKIEDRIEVLKKAKNLLTKNWKIFFTNWNLIGQKRYEKSIIANSLNEFWSLDFDIKIWDFSRYYHSFTLSELEFLFQKSWLNIIENRVFDNSKNIISIVN